MIAKFDTRLLNIFDALDGAYSVVTHREANGDRSITIDQTEKEIIYQFYHSDTFDRKGGAPISGNSETKDFSVHTSLTDTTHKSLKIYHPKKTGTELRLYFNAATIEANEGDYIFIYRKPNEPLPYIGVMNPTAWNELITSSDEDRQIFHMELELDDEDDQFQKAVSAAAVKQPITTNNLKYPRSSAVALNALKMASYKCESGYNHVTFTKRATGKPYQEPHHFIPVSLNKYFPVGLDVEENICSLCPTCHRLIHHGSDIEKKELLEKLWQDKKDGLGRRGILVDFDDILKIYVKQP